MPDLRQRPTVGPSDTVPLNTPHLNMYLLCRLFLLKLKNRSLWQSAVYSDPYTLMPVSKWLSVQISDTGLNHCNTKDSQMNKTCA